MLRICEGSACVSGKTKCAPESFRYGLAEFQNILRGRKKLKHRRVGKECLPVRQTGRLTRCLFVVSFLCLWSPVNMVYFFSSF